MKIETLSKICTSNWFIKRFAKFLSKNRDTIVYHFETFNHLIRPNIWKYLFEFYTDDENIDRVLISIAAMSIDKGVAYSIDDAWIVDRTLYILSTKPGILIGRSGKNLNEMKDRLRDWVDDIQLIENKGVKGRYEQLLRSLKY